MNAALVMTRSAKPPLTARAVRRIALFSAAALLAQLLLPSTAEAQRAQPAATAEQVQYRKAHEAIKAKNWAEARRLLIDLWSRSQTYDVAASLGQVEYWLGNYASGARFVTFALKNLPPAEKPDMVDQLDAALDELRSKIGTVKVLVNEPGADVRLDGQPIGTSPLSSDVFVDPGLHVFQAQRAGALPAEAKLETRAGQGYVVELTLAPTGAATSTAPAPAPPPADRPPPAEPEPEKKSMLPLYVAGGVALAGISTGIAFTVAAGNTTDRIEKLQSKVGEGGCQGPTKPAECSELVDAASSRDTQRNLSYLSFAVAGAAVVGGAVYLLWPSDSPSRAAAATGIGVTWLPGGTFVTVRGAL